MPDYGQRHRADPQKSLVGFVVGDVHYAIGIAQVREIVNPLPVTPLPHTPVEVSGVADHRGDVIPVLELRARFGLPPQESSRSTKWILVDIGSRLVFIVVDAVSEVFGTGADEIRPTPALGGAKDMRGIVGVTNHSGVLVFVLDTKRFTQIVEDIAEMLPPAEDY